MNELDRERLTEKFHVPVYETRGIQAGIIMRFPTFYLKIYDDGASNYRVQVWNHDGQVKEINIDQKHLYDTIDTITKSDMIFMCSRYGIPINTSDCYCCPYSRSCDTYITINTEIDGDNGE